MTLQCQCGGAVELTNQSYGEESAVESYQCASCNDTGTLTMTETGQTLTGCLNETGTY